MTCCCDDFNAIAASLDAAVKAAAAVLAASSKPVLLGGPRLRANHRRSAFKQLAEAFKVSPMLMWRLQASRVHALLPQQ
jgi:thiamine pyrophosphate-dependent acetolactate synthase large subunit-like protein